MFRCTSRYQCSIQVIHLQYQVIHHCNKLLRMLPQFPKPHDPRIYLSDNSSTQHHLTIRFCFVYFRASILLTMNPVLNPQIWASVFFLIQPPPPPPPRLYCSMGMPLFMDFQYLHPSTVVFRAKLVTCTLCTLH